MNKKLFSSLLIFVFVAMIVINAEAIVNFVAEVIIPKPSISHTPVTNVSSVERNLNVEATVDFGVYTSAPEAQLLYYFDGDSSNIRTASKGSIQNGQPFYIETGKFDADHNSISYKIKVNLKGQGDLEEDIYWPEDGIFHTVSIANSTSTVIGDQGGTVEIDDGNQETGNTSIVIEPGTEDPGSVVIIEEVNPDDDEFYIIRNNFAETGITIVPLTVTKTGLSDGNGGVTDYTSPHFMSFSIGTVTNAKKFELRYRKNKATTPNWADAEIIKILDVDLEQRLVTAKIIKGGYYGVFELKDVSDKDYKPAKRVRVKSRISAYGGFMFNNLKEGDVVKIYATTGKKVAELTEGTARGFEWKGREGTNNSGDWAESGTYIYQIKLKEKGKVISGTIAFVW